MLRYRGKEALMKSINYSNVKIKDLGKGGKFSYLKLLTFWPIFGLLFALLERGLTNRTYIIVHCALDNAIPFCEWFLFAYLFWFIYIVGMLAYTLFFDIEAFRKYMEFVILTYSITLIIYFIFPTAQNLRPQQFAHNNILTRFLSVFYKFDTNTNVMPSLHVIGAMAVSFAAWHSKLFGRVSWRIVFSLVTILICLSTMFIKQHSVIDILTALCLCFAAYPIIYRAAPRK